MAQLNFDPSAQAPMQPMGALPAGKYELVIVATEIKDAKSGSGTYLLVTSDVVSGTHAKRKFFDRFNLTNDNQQAEQIGRSQLAALCHAVGITGVLADSVELEGRSFVADLSVKKDDQGEQNKVKGYYPAGGILGAPVAAAAPAATGKAPPPWAAGKSKAA